MMTVGKQVLPSQQTVRTVLAGQDRNIYPYCYLTISPSLQVRKLTWKCLFAVSASCIKEKCPNARLGHQPSAVLLSAQVLPAT